LDEVIKKEEDEVQNQKLKKKELEQTGTDVLGQTIVVKDESGGAATKVSDFTE